MKNYMEAPCTLYLGKQGENCAREITFREPGVWTKELGAGIAQLLVNPPGHGKVYPVILEERRGTAVWRVTAADTARPGYGRCELRWSVGGTVVKSRVYTTYVAEGLSGGCGCGDDNWGRYLEEITRAGADALAAASRAENAAYHAPAIMGGNWWVWDPEEDGYKDTGIPATGEGGGDCGCDAATDAEVEEMLDEIFGSRE